jgi:SAM-dependent MidA family methyltransferase
VAAADEIVRRIRREGPITFDAFVELALYGEGGFFAAGHGAGRAGRDFVTSPEVGGLFGACVARELDRRWDALGRPDPFVVVEAGAGTGRLAADVLRAGPTCAPALRYVLVERSAELRARQRDRLDLEPADEALGPFLARAGADEPVPEAGAGPVCASLADLPGVTFEGVVIANELLDNLPFGVAEWSGDRWHEVRVTTEGDELRELLVPAAPADADLLGALTAGIDLPSGARLPLARGLEAWLASCGRVLHRGVVVVVDYVDDVRGVVARGPRAWIRTYRAHARGGDPLDAPGSQDVTADVVSEQLVHAARAAGFSVAQEWSQAEWLRGLGIDALAAEGRRAWERGAARGDLDALAGWSRVHEADALTDPAGLGGHRVVVLAKGLPG